jgi:hypothetical protein
MSLTRLFCGGWSLVQLSCADEAFCCWRYFLYWQLAVGTLRTRLEGNTKFYK